MTEFTYTRSSRTRRFFAFVIDHCIMMTFLPLVVFIPFMLSILGGHSPSSLSATFIVVVVLIFVIYFAKDSFKGISVGRWLMGIAVRDRRDPNIIPSFARLFLRNIFLIIWPIELIVLACNSNKERLGDQLAKTIVVNNPEKLSPLETVFQSIAPYKNIILKICIAIFIFFLVFFGLAFFILFSTMGKMKDSDAYKIAIHEIQQNEEIIGEVGGIKGFGRYPAGSFKMANGRGQAELIITVKGNTKDIKVAVNLKKKLNGQWELVDMEK